MAAFLVGVLSGPGERQDADVRGRVLEAILLFPEPEIGDGEEVEERFGLGGQTIRVDPHRLHQILKLGDSLPGPAPVDQLRGDVVPVLGYLIRGNAADVGSHQLGPAEVEVGIAHRIRQGLPVKSGEGIGHPDGPGGAAGAGSAWLSGAGEP